MREYLNLRANIALGLTVAFLANIFGPMPLAQAQDYYLPAPGVMVHLSLPFDPPILKGIKVYPNNPFRFDFILDQGDDSIRHPETEATKLIKYFLASLTIPEKDLWVNLSPYEKDRIIPNSFGLTEMGRDLLAEDYMLKQITASIIYPEDGTGKKFWKRVYEEAGKKFGTTNIPVNTFNKVWIVPEKAVVYENAQAGTAYVIESKLKVMLEQDYLALSHNVIPAKAGIHSKNDINFLDSQITREIVLPELTKEVNEGKNFAQLRQVYNSLILAAWYKKKIKDSILEQVYADKNKVAGVQYTSSVIAGSDATKRSFDTELIYQRYLQAFKKGTYNYIKEDQDPITQQIVPRKYFSGGVDFAMNTDSNFSNSGSWIKFISNYTFASAKGMFQATVNLAPSKAQVRSIGLAASLATSLIMGPGYAQQSPAALTMEEQDQTNTKEYWQKLMARKEGYIDVFSRSKEFLDKPFAPEILKKAMLYATYDRDYSSFAAAIYSYDQYATLPQAKGIIEFAIQHYSIFVSSDFDHILRFPKGEDLVMYGIKLDPLEALDTFDPKSLENSEEDMGNGGQADKNQMTRFWQFLEGRTDNISKTLLTIYKTQYDFETKERLTALLSKLIDGTLTLKQAVSMTKDDDEYFRALSSMRSASQEIGQKSIDRLMRTVASSIVKSSHRDRIIDTFSATELFYFLGAASYENLNYDKRRILYDKFKEKLQEHPEDWKDLISQSSKQPFRDFLRNLAASDQLLEFLKMFNDGIVIQFFNSFIDESPFDSKYGILGPDELPNLAVPIVMSNYLAKRIDDPNEKKRYEVLNTKFRNELKDKIEGYLEKEKKRADFLDFVGFYHNEDNIQGLFKEALENKAQNPSFGTFFTYSGSFLNYDYGRDLFINAAHRDPLGVIEAMNLTLNKDIFLDDNLDADSIWNNLIKNGYISSDGLVQNKLHQLVESHLGIIMPGYSVAQNEIVNDILQQQLNDSDSVIRYFQDSPDLVIRKIYEINALNVPLQQKRYISLLTQDLLNGKLSLEAAIALTKTVAPKDGDMELVNPLPFRRYLLDHLSQENVIGRVAIDGVLNSYYLYVVNKINARHDQPDPVRFFILKDASLVDMYNISVIGEDEIYTSSFNGIFNRLLAKMKEEKISGNQLLDNVHYNKFRIFIHLAIRYGRINEFLNRMDQQSRLDLMEKFVRNIEREKDPLKETSLAADAFMGLKDPVLLERTQTVLKEEYTRAQGTKEGTAIYGLLSGLFGKNALVDPEWFAGMQKKYPMPYSTGLTEAQLFDANNENIQRYYFYNDDGDNVNDGKESFNSFEAKYKSDPNWIIVNNPDYVEIDSIKGHAIRIFADKPDNVGEGNSEIDKLFKRLQITPTVVAHRGHSFHIESTIMGLKPTVKFFYSGSCGGFTFIKEVLDETPLADILATKGTGMTSTNDAIEKFINEIIRKDGKIFWDIAWTQMQARFGQMPAFNDYVSPGGNTEVNVIKAYKRMTDDDKAMGTITKTFHDYGGIDLTPANMNLQTQNNGGEIKFNIDPTILKQLQNAPGFVPVIISIQPLKSLPEFLEIAAYPSS